MRLNDLISQFIKQDGLASVIDNFLEIREMYYRQFETEPKHVEVE